MSVQRTDARPLARALLVLLAVVTVFVGCTRAPARGTRTTWIAGCSAPAFDPDGPPDAMRQALERWLSPPLVGLDSLARPAPALAARWDWSADSLTVAFHLSPALRYTDGTRCRADDVVAALEASLARTDHATAAWALAAVRGVDAIRAGHSLPPLGLHAADSATVTLTLVRRDPWLVLKLARAQLGRPWRDRGAAAWKDAVGLGPFAVESETPGVRVTLVSASRAARTDTLAIRFLPGEGRVRAALRAHAGDVVWPVPPGLAREPIPAGYAVRRRAATPPRLLVLVMREDVPPTTKLPARAALAHTLNRTEVLRVLDTSGRDVGAWLTGAPPFAFPGYDVDEAHDWMQRGKLGRSFHVTMAFEAEGVAAAVARTIQGEWARDGIYVDLMPLKRADWQAEALRGWRAQLLLVDHAGFGTEPALALGALLTPGRGPAVGAFRTGWRTREFDAGLRAGRSGALEPAFAQRRLEEELVALPLAALPWEWIERSGFGRSGPDPRPGNSNAESLAGH